MKLHVYSIFHLDFNSTRYEMLSYTCSTKVLKILLFGSKRIHLLLYILCTPFAIPPHVFPLAQPKLVLCELTGTVPVHLRGWRRVSFEKWVGTKMLSNVIIENYCYETDALLKEMNANERVSSHYTFMHMYALFCSYYTTLSCTLPCAGHSWVQKPPHVSTGFLGNPFGQRSLAVPGEAPLPLHKAHSGEL